MEASLFEFFDGHPERWTKKAFARTGKGYAISVTHKTAICWCVEGARNLLFPPSEENLPKRVEIHRLITTELKRRKGRFVNPVDWNDDEETTFEEFLDVLKTAGV